MSNILKFKVSSGIKDIVGKDLITDDFIAVFELVKNSYDAHAKDVVIKFLKDKIIIADNGKGMTLEEIKTKWLFLAYSAKKDNTEDKEKLKNSDTTYRDKIQSRIHYAGSKGIGRFSADRLGKKLKLITKSIISNEVEQIKIDWRDFNDQNTEFGTINIDHETLENNTDPFPNDTNHGLILEIENVSRWPREKIIELKHSLEKLINPFSETNDFNIDIECQRELFEDENGVYRKKPNRGEKYSERDKVNGKVKNAILDILELKTTQIIVEIRSRQIETRIYDRGTLIYHIKEANKNFDLLEDVKIDLFFLNTAAKNNFTRKMGIEPINFGSVFLFKNGFRVQPFGNSGDDSWGLDFRAQQGHSRYLGTRDLFGRIEIITENTEEFKEVSSRDGGLVKTNGYDQLITAFKEKALVRLERYVVGVLWGEAFKKKNYFGKGSDALEKAERYRKELQENDKNSESIVWATSNLGSKIDFIQLIKNLSSNKDIEIVDFNREFVDIINEKLDEIDSKYLNDLETIAEKTNDPELKVQVLEADKRYKQLIAEKEEAELKAKKEEQKRIEAEARAIVEENARKKAEKNQKEEEEKRIKAENAKLKAENAQLKAEQIAKEEEEKRKIAESAFERERKKNLFFNATGKDANNATTGLIHHIKLTSKALNTRIKILVKDTVGNKFDKQKTLEILSEIQKYSDKIQKLSEIVTYSNLNYKYAKHDGDIIVFIKEYINEIKPSYRNINFNVNIPKESLIKEFSILEISIVFDNLISNATKRELNNDTIQIDVKKLKDKLEVIFSDNGPGISLESSNYIFDLGYTTTRGSGIGLYMVKDIINEMGGEINFIGNNIVLKGASFKLIF
jgi:signal transduction histidine kinase